MKLNVSRGFKPGTRIKSIKVPDALRVKRSTGLGWMDEALGDNGGFTPTSVMMLTGGPGTGKSTLMRQLADTMTTAGHIVVYNTGEESLYQAKMSCERLLLEEDFMVAEETMLPNLLTFMDNVKKANPTRQVVLLQDSLQTLDDGKYVDKKGKSRGTTSKTPTYCAEMLVEWTQRTFAISAFVGQCTKGDLFAGQNTIKHAIDVHTHIFYDDAKKSETYGMLLLEVQKNRWGCNGSTMIVELSPTGMICTGSFTKGQEAFRKANTEADEIDEAAE